MKLSNVIDVFTNVVNYNDVCIFSNELCSEAFKNDREGNFYMGNINGMTASFGLGVAMCTDKRVFIFISDGEFLREFGATPQLAVSKCNNVFYIILHSGRYISSGGQLNIFGEVKAPKGLLFNLGFLVHDYTHYFRNKGAKNSISKLFKRVIGPLAVLVNVDHAVNDKLDDPVYYNAALKNRFINFVLNKDLGTSIYKPASLDNIKNVL